MKYTVKCIEVGIMPTNCYIIKKCDSRDALVIDPGDDENVIRDELHKADASLRGILLTHGHFDHILAVGALRQVGKPVMIHELDAHSLTERDMFSPLVRFDPRPFEKADVLITDGGICDFCGFEFEIMHTPGHTDGSVCYIFDDIMFSGDTLFKDSVGTLDYGGDRAKMQSTLKMLASLEKDYTVFAGHGEMTSLAREKRFNPYLSKFVSRDQI